MKLRLHFVILLFSPLFLTKNVHAQQSPFGKYHDKDFIKIDSLAGQAQPKAALVLIGKLNNKARAEHNVALLIKSVLYRTLFQGYLEENALVKVISDLNKDIAAAAQPEKSVLQSLLAETYWNYYQQNRYQIAKRGVIQGQNSDDVRVWSVDRLTTQIIHTYLASLSAAPVLQHTKVSILQTILSGDTATRFLRPTLYDLLAHRALDVLISTQIDLTQKDNRREKEDEQLLLMDGQEFLESDLPFKDSTNFKTQALDVFRKLMQFHSHTLNRNALADADLKRVRFLYQRSTAEDKTQSYLAALQQMARAYRQTVIYADIIYEQALVYKEESSTFRNRKPDLLKALKLAQMAVTASPGSVAALNAESLIKQIQSPSLSFQISSNNLPLKPVQLSFSYKNVDTIEMALYRIPTSIDPSGAAPGTKADYHAFIKKNKALKNWQIALPVVSDYQQHSYADRLEGLPIGNYMIIAFSKRVAEGQNKIYCAVNFRMTNMAVLNRRLDDERQVYLIADSRNGAPLAGVHIDEINAVPGKNGYKYEKAGVTLLTGKNGAVTGKIGNIKNALISTGTDSLYLSDYNYYWHADQVQNKVLFFADKPVYRPGQTVFYKGILLQNGSLSGENGISATQNGTLPGKNGSVQDKRQIRDQKISYENDNDQIKAGETLEVFFKDANGKELQKTTVTTNAYGTFQGSFIIPAGLLNGRMQISTLYGNLSVQVEEYKRPRFEVSFNPPAKPYKLNDTAVVTGKAITFSGYPVTGAKVKYTISKIAIHSAASGISVREVSSGTTETFAGGIFKISFLTDSAKNKNDSFSYYINAQITDGSGETKSVNQAINLGLFDRELDTDLPDQLFIRSKSDTLAFNIKRKRGNEPVRLKLEAEWFRLAAPERLLSIAPGSYPAADVKPEKYSLSKEEFIRSFPNEDYAGDSDPVNWEATTTGFRDSIAVNSGTAILKLNNSVLKPGYYSIHFRGLDSDGDTLKIEKIIRIYHSAPEKIRSTREWLVVEKNMIGPSEDAVFRLAGLIPDGNAWYEVYYKGNVVEEVQFKTGLRQRIIRIKARKGFKDEFAVQFTMIQNGKIYNELKKIQITDQSAQLDIRLVTFRDKLQPGEKESWKIQVSDKTGEKQVAEMVATLYDASLDGLRKMEWPKPGAETYNYRPYLWNCDLNMQTKTTEIWDGGNSWYGKALVKRAYEHFELFASSGYLNLQHAYRNYMLAMEIKARNENVEKALKKVISRLKENTIYGVVTDGYGNALKGVQIRQGNLTTVTDEYGIYQIAAVTGDHLIVSHLEYSRMEIVLAGETRLNIILNNDNIVLHEVTTTAAQTMSREMVVVTARGIGALGTEATVGTLVNQEVVEDTKVYDFVSINSYDAKTGLLIVNGKALITGAAIVPRSKFNESAFFYPQLQTNAEGEIQVDFTIPQSVTRYRMMAFAHTRDLRTGFKTAELVTRKQLSVSANLPRFFREGDTVLLTAKISNLSGLTLKGIALIELKNAMTGEPIHMLASGVKAEQEFNAAYLGNSLLKWQLVIPKDVTAITCKVTAESGRYNDGEEITVPVLPNKVLITESMPFSLRPGQQKLFRLNQLSDADQPAKRSLALTLEYTANPVWYALQALPYLMESSDQSSEQVFNRYFANRVAAAVMNRHPEIKALVNSWKQQGTSAAMLSPLDKNPELKSVLIRESPWLGAAQTETEQRQQLANWLDVNQLNARMKDDFLKLEKMQREDGSFPWFGGMGADRYFTEYIVLGTARLEHLKSDNKQEDQLMSGQMIRKAKNYLDQELKADYRKTGADKRIGYLQLQDLYRRSFNPGKAKDTELNEALDYYLKKVTEQWKAMEPEQQGMAALILFRNGYKAEALKALNLLRQRAQHSEEMGMYWPLNPMGLAGYQSPVETQALLIDAFQEIAADTTAVEEMKIWLLKNKQTSNWKTTKATAAACYALFNTGSSFLSEQPGPEILLGGRKPEDIGRAGAGKVEADPTDKQQNNSLTKSGGRVPDNMTGKEFDENGLRIAAAEAGTGYRKIIIPGQQVKAEMGKMQAKNTSKSLIWGALYWQHFEKADDAAEAKSGNAEDSRGLKLKKQLFLNQQTEKGTVLIPLTEQSVLRPGDLLTVRMEIDADRSMDYLHLKDMRSSGFEPVNVISQNKFQDGLGYYETTKDASSDFYISYLPKGVYVLAYNLRVSHAGNFSNGITLLESMYAPEFSTYSKGARFRVKL